MTRARSLMVAAVCLALMPVGAAAQSADAWRFQALLYGYLPTISGTTTFPQSGLGSNVSVDADTILENLKGVFMGSFDASKGRWGVATDVMYMNVGNGKSQTRDIAIGGAQIPAGASGNLDFDLKGWVLGIAGTYQVVQDPVASMQILAGARLLDIKQTLNWQLSGNIGSIPLPGRQGNVESKISNWDAIIGARGRLAFGSERRWFVPYYLDVGTGDSDLTWQAMAGLGYSFPWGDVLAAWRYLDYDMKSGSSVESLNFNGPGLGVAFRW